LLRYLLPFRSVFPWMGGTISGITDMVLPLAEKAIAVVSDPIAAALPEAATLFKDVSRTLLGEHPPSDRREASDAQQARSLVESLPSTRPSGRQAKMARVLELLMDELEG